MFISRGSLCVCVCVCVCPPFWTASYFKPVGTCIHFCIPWVQTNAHHIVGSQKIFPDGKHKFHLPILSFSFHKKTKLNFNYSLVWSLTMERYPLFFVWGWNKLLKITEERHWGQIILFMQSLLPGLFPVHSRYSTHTCWYE